MVPRVLTLIGQEQPWFGYVSIARRVHWHLTLIGEIAPETDLPGERASEVFTTLKSSKLLTVVLPLQAHTSESLRKKV